MPKGLRALEKLVRVIDEELQSIGAQKMSMPTMIQASLWKKTGMSIHVSAPSKTEGCQRGGKVMGQFCIIIQE